MNAPAEVSRRDFFKFVPKYLAHHLHAVTKEFYKPADTEMRTQAAGTIRDNRARVAEINKTSCLAWGGGSCELCYWVCPLQDTAITLEDQKPIIHPIICDGCAKCMTACRTINASVAVIMSPVK